MPGDLGRAGVELRELRHFIAVAEELHFGRAADRLHVSQPALSRSVGRLEERLGYVLLVRDSRGVSLTAAGVVFLREAREVLDRVDAAVFRAGQVAREASDEVRLGWIATGVDLLLPGTLAELERGGSEVRLELVELEVRESDRALRDGRVDLCFVPRSALGDGIESEELLRDPWIAVVPEVHRLAGRETAHLADLAGETVIVLERDDDWRDASRAVIAQLGSAVRPGLRASGPSVALCLVRAGMGICVLPATAINAFVPGLRVIVLEDTGMHWMLARLPGSVSQASLTVSDAARRAARRIPHDCGISSVLRALADR